MHFAFGGERECKNASPLSSNASAASNHLAFAPPLGTEGGAAVHRSRRHDRKGPALEVALPWSSTGGAQIRARAPAG